MRYLIISDIHANWEALEAVIADSDGSCDQILCCGDIVGYGADPNAVVDWVRENVHVLIRGNHDKACVGLNDLEWFNPSARASAVWTEQTLRPENLEYLRAMQRGPVAVGDFQILHGSPLDEDEYLVDTTDASMLRDYLTMPVSFFGHTHLQGGFQILRNGIRRISPVPMNSSELVLPLELEEHYLINCGSVGQPRDGDPRAAYALYNPEERSVVYRRVPYDVEKAQSKILEAGLPELLAFRLGAGR